MKQERGFALLLVFVMAAAVAITLYRELPRVAFEAQRNREQMLIERGEQYKRAIQLYVRKIKKYPASIEELEGTNSVRFLRKRYNDPMTGKGEWRIVHIDAAGVYTDSLVHKPKPAKEEEKSTNTFTYEAPGLGTAQTQTGQAGQGFPQVRASERVGIRPPGQQQNTDDPANPQQPPQPGQQQAGVTYPNPNVPGALPFPQGIPGLPPGAVPPATPGFPPGVVPPGGFPGQPANSQTGGVSPSPYPYSTQPGAQGAPPPFGQPGATPIPGQPGQNQALNLINQILTTPRASPQSSPNQPAAGGTQFGAGIAGIASTVERIGIKVYNEKEQYNEWEFLYDPTKDKSGLLTGPGVAGQPGQNQPPGVPPVPGMQPPPQQPGMPQQPLQPQQPRPAPGRR